MFEKSLYGSPSMIPQRNEKSKSLLLYYNVYLSHFFHEKETKRLNDWITVFKQRNLLDSEPKIISLLLERF